MRSWSVSVRRIRENLSPWRDEAKRATPILDDLIRLSGKALLYGTPQCSKLVAKRAAESYRLVQQSRHP